MEVRKQWKLHVLSAKIKRLQTNNSIPSKLPFKNEEEIKTFPDK